MGAQRKHRLIQIDWPTFGEATRPAPPPASELRQRLAATLAAMERRGLTHLVVYADREHFANLAFLTNFEPRYEEALLILSQGRKPLVLVGNESQAYLPISPLHVEGDLRHERYQAFSLIDQPRGTSRMIREIFAGEGIGMGAQVGCAGWKTFTEADDPRGRRAIEIPAFLVDTLRELAGSERVVNATDVFMDADTGLRTFCSASEIAFFEYSNVLASEGVRRILFAVQEGVRDDELVTHVRYNGIPLAAHMTVKTGKAPTPLSSPSGSVVERGNRLSTNVCYWGSNICRAGWVASSAADLPSEARDYAAAFAGPYFEVMGAWLRGLEIGASGGALAALVAERLPFDKFGIFLNPGHLIHLDEWVSSPFYVGSSVRLHSGMAIQVDVIPSSKTYYSTRMEDGLVLADETLQRELATRYPAVLERCRARRKFMADVLGIDVPEAVLPLSNIPAIVPPWFLAPNTVFALER